MKKYLLIYLLALPFALCSCIGGTHLRTESVRDTSEVSGTYRLILYGRTYPGDLETAAILDLEGDGFEIEPFAPEFSYRVFEGLEARRAVEEAMNFVRTRKYHRHTRIRRVTDVNGNTIGYDVRRLGKYFAHGFGEVLDITYWLVEGGKVKAVIKFRDEAKRDGPGLGGD